MIKAPLSELSRGKGEKRGSYVDVIYEDKDLFNQIGLSKQDKQENVELKKLPKTYSTRKGELFIFSEDLNSVESHDGSKNSQFTSSIRDFRRNVLDFGTKSCPPFLSSTSLSREHTFDSFSHLLTERDLGLSYFYDRVRPGYSAKRYLAHWTRNWKPDLINKLYKEGKLRDESLFEIMSQRSNDRFRLDDDLTRIPPVYKIQRNWLEMNVDIFKGYQFYRTSSANDDQRDGDQVPTFKVNKERQDMQHDDSKNIQVIDKKGNKVDYSNLSRADQEAVLAELLIHTALKTMNDSNENKNKLNENNNENNNHLDFPIDKKSKIKEFKPLNMAFEVNSSSYIFPALCGNKLSSLTKVQNNLKVQTKNITKHFNDKANHDISKTDPLNDRTDNFVDLENNIKSQVQDGNSLMNHMPSEENKKLNYFFEMENGELDDHDSLEHWDEKNVLPKVSNTHKFQPKLHAKHDNHHQDRHLQNNKRDHKKGVIVIGPDGEQINVGKTLLYEANPFESEKSNKPNQNSADDVVYRLFDKIPPYLYYTNKLEENIFIKFGKSHYLKIAFSIPNIIIFDFKIERERSKPINTVLTKQIEQSEKKLNSNVPIINKNIIKALVSHAQKIAKLALESDGSGSDLSKDIKVALTENLKNQQQSNSNQIIETENYNSFKDFLKKSFKDLFKQSHDFSNIEIDEYVLENLLEFPPAAFEIATDPKRNKKILQIKKSFKDKFLLEQKSKAKNAIINEIKIEETQTENFHSQKGSQYRKKGSDSTAKKQLDISSNNDNQIEISTNITDELRDEVKLENLQLRRESRILLPAIDMQYATNDPIMKVERMHFEEKLLRRRSSRHSLSIDMINLMNMKFATTISEKNEKSTEEKMKQQPSQKKTTSNTNDQKKTVSNSDEAIKHEIKSSDDIQSDLKKRKKTRKIAAKNPMKSRSTGDVSTVNKDENEDDIKKLKKIKSRKSEQKKVFKFGPFKDDMSIKNIYEPGTSATGNVIKKRKKESKAKKKLIAEVTSQLEKRRLEKKEDGMLNKFKPLNPVNEEDFEGVDLNQLERLNMQEEPEEEEVMFTKIVDPQDVRDFKRRQIIEEKRREIERRRQEQEEEKRKQQEEAARREKAERELAEEMKRREDELRLKRMAEAAKRRKNAEAEAEKKRQEEMQAEIERKAREDYSKKMEEMRIKFIKEMRLKAKQEEERRQEEERKQREEEVRLLEMSEQEKFDYLRRKREAEENERLRMEEEQRRRQEELNRAFEEAKRIAAEEAARKAELEKKLAFTRSVREEKSILNASQSVTRAFTFSYFELLKYLSEMEKENLDPSIQPKENDIRKPTGPSVHDTAKASK